VVSALKEGGVAMWWIFAAAAAGFCLGYVFGWFKGVATKDNVQVSLFSIGSEQIMPDEEKTTKIEFPPKDHIK